MGQDSKIEWTHHTFNPWIGCTKVSAGCAHCYAETLMDHRYGKAKWGPSGTRVRTSEANWRQPLKWDRDAKAKGERHRVFCASLADVFEGPDTMPAEAWEGVRAARRDLFDLVCRTPNLDWLVLTKRPENALRLMVEAGLYAAENPSLPCPQPNLWIGTSVEDQKAANERIPHLLKVPAAVRFLSMEPLLGPVEIVPLAYRGQRFEDFVENCLHYGSGAIVDLEPTPNAVGRMGYIAICRMDAGDMIRTPWNVLKRGAVGLRPGLDWAIVGGESGPGARPMHPTWAKSLRDQCAAADIAFHFKQWGEWLPISDALPQHMAAPQGDVWYERENDPDDLPVLCYRVGKHAAGRTLDGQTWDEFPTPTGACQ